MTNESQTTNPLTMMHRLKMLRQEMRTHNPESENVQTMDWAIHLIEEVGNSVRRLKHLDDCIKSDVS